MTNASMLPFKKKTKKANQMAQHLFSKPHLNQLRI